MPADRQVVLTFGRRGLNLRDHPVLVHRAELVDSLNWQIGEDELVKRLGTTAFGVQLTTGADVLELAVFQPAGGTPLLVAYCANGKVYKTDDGDPWTEIASGLSTTARPTFVQYLDKIYWSNGVDNPRSYDGTTVVDMGASVPKGEFLAVWRNRLWIGQKNIRKVWWSKSGDPTDWTNTNNNVTFPNWPALTGLWTAPNIGTEADAGDGILVFTSRSTHRIVDDSDNTASVVIGGANVLVDSSHGCVANRTLANVRKRVYFLGLDGIYSTDGHEKLRLESAKINGLFTGQIALGSAANMIGLDWQGRYLFGFTAVGQTENTQFLELYLDLNADEDGQYPWMAHNVAARAWVRFPASSGDILYYADASSGDTRYVRRLFVGGSDIDGASTTLDIRAYARSGGMNFDVEQPKLVRRIYAHGFGALTVGVIPDFDPGHTDSALLDLRTSETDALWDGGQWDGGVWDVGSGHHGMPAYMGVRGRWFSFEVTEVSKETTASDPRLGLGTVSVGGAALHALQVTHAPLDAP